MKLIDSVKAKAVIWAVEAFTDEKYKFRRAVLVPLLRKKIDGYFEGVKMAEEQKPEDGKSKWKSKAFLTAAVTVLIGAVQPISTALGHPIVVPDWVIQVLVGLGLYGLRDAVGKNSALK